MTEHLQLLFQRFGFSFLELRIVELLELVADVLFVGLVLRLLGDSLPKSLLCLTEGVVGVCVILPFLQIVGSRIQDFQLEALGVEQQVLVLGVYVDEMDSKLLELSEGGG